MVWAGFVESRWRPIIKRVPAFTLERKEVGVAGQADAGIPDPTGVTAVETTVA
jgi:hypothetical protein